MMRNSIQIRNIRFHSNKIDFRSLLLYFLLILLPLSAQTFNLNKTRVLGSKKISLEELQLRTEKLFGESATPAALLSFYKKIYHSRGFAFCKFSQNIVNRDSLFITVNEGPRCILKKVTGIPDTVRFEYFYNVPIIYNPEEMSQQIEHWLEEMAQLGKPLAKIEINDLAIKSISVDSAEITLDLKFSDIMTIYVKRFTFSGLQHTDQKILLKQLLWSMDLPFTPGVQNQITESLNKLRIFDRVANPEIIEIGDKKSVLISVVEAQAMTFDGIVGYVPEKRIGLTTQQGYFTGLLNMNFGNLFGSARKLYIHWKKPDRLSDEFQLKYKEPWIFNSPIHAIIGFHRRVQDTLFIKQGFGIEFEYPMSYRIRLYTRFEQNYTIPDSNAAISAGITRNSHSQYVTGFIYDNRDFPVNPKNGVMADINFSYGNKRISGPQYLLEQDSSIQRKQESQILNLKIEAFYEIFARNVVAFKFKSTFMRFSPGKADDADQVWFGGATSLRGYRENQFRSDKFAINTIEYRLLTGIKSRIYAFFDYAIFNNHASTINRSGFGVGVRMETGLGVLAIDYGLASGDPFSQGKIHIGIVNEF